MKVEKEELQELVNYIETDHKGDYIPIVLELSRAIYMLHYLAEENVDEVKLQNTCYELFRLIECFCEAGYVKYSN